MQLISKATSQHHWNTTAGGFSWKPSHSHTPVTFRTGTNATPTARHTFAYATCAQVPSLETLQRVAITHLDLPSSTRMQTGRKSYGSLAFNHTLYIKMAQHLDSRCVAPTKTRLESSMKKFKPHFIYELLFCFFSGTAWWRPVSQLQVGLDANIHSRHPAEVKQAWNGNCAQDNTCRIDTYYSTDPALQKFANATALLPGQSSIHYNIARLMVSKWR